MRRILILLAAIAAMLLLPMAPALANNPIVTGGSSNGSYVDHDYLANSHDMISQWVRASQSGDDVGEFDAYIFAHDLPDYNGDKICVQIAYDWKYESHYDSRVFRTCQPNYSWDPSNLLEPNRTCNDHGVLIGCDMTIKRIQFAKYVPANGALLGEECRDFGTSACDGWEPRCGFTDNTPTSCYVVWRHRDGTTDKLGSMSGDDVKSPYH